MIKHFRTNVYVTFLPRLVSARRIYWQGLIVYLWVALYMNSSVYTFFVRYKVISRYSRYITCHAVKGSTWSFTYFLHRTMSCARDSIRHSRTKVIIKLLWQLCNLSVHCFLSVCLCASIKLLLEPVIANTERMYYFVQYIYIYNTTLVYYRTVLLHGNSSIFIKQRQHSIPSLFLIFLSRKFALFTILFASCKYLGLNVKHPHQNIREFKLKEKKNTSIAMMHFFIYPFCE